MMLQSNAVPETGDEVNNDDDDDKDKKHYKQQSYKKRKDKRKVSMCELYNTYNDKKSVSYNFSSTGTCTNEYTLRNKLTQKMTKPNNKTKQNKTNKEENPRN